jgi:hypothetical protein
MLIPGDLKKAHREGKFVLFMDRENFNGTEEEYQQ